MIRSFSPGEASRLRRAALASIVVAAGAGGVSAVAAPSASALTDSWSCTLSPNQWCERWNNHSWTRVRARWGSTGNSLAMCSKLLIINSSPEIIYARNCATAVEVWANTTTTSTQLIPAIANGNNANNHVIAGYAQT